MGIDAVRKEIEHMRLQIRRQQGDILRLQRAGIDITAAAALLARMQDKVDGLAAERGRLLGEARLQARKYPGTNKVINGTPAARRM